MATPIQPQQDRHHSLEEIHSSVAIPKTALRRLYAFFGPAFLISVGYMDPGNWATDIEAGSKFGYRLMWVLLLSNLMAVLLQTLSTRLGIVTGRDLAQACRENYSRSTAFVLWILCEIAIAACDLAEVIGTVIALKLLFGIPYLFGLSIAAADTFLLLALQRRGVRVLEAVTLALIAVIAGSFCCEIFWSRPDWAAVLRGFVPGFDTANRESFQDSLYVAIGIIGATVMPHNLYLHSALVQTRAFSATTEGKRLACKYNFLDSLLALNGAFFINAGILILSVSVFIGREKITLHEAYRLIGMVWGLTIAQKLFALALLASGQSSTLTGTLAGQVVMEGFIRLRIRPWARRLLTRSLAIVPALFAVALSSNEQVLGETVVNERLMTLLVLSQVVLSFQLPFAIIPLVQFTSDRRLMGDFASRAWVKALAWCCAALVIGLNGFLIYLQINEWAATLSSNGWSEWWIYGTVGPVSLGLAGFLFWLTFLARRGHFEEAPWVPTIPALPDARYTRIGVAVEFAAGDILVLGQAVALAQSNSAVLVPIHVVEGLGAAFYGAETDNQESRDDRDRMQHLLEELRTKGIRAEGVLGYGGPAEELVRIAQEQKLDLLVLGTHGHRFLADLALGQTVSPVLHRLRIPVLVIPNNPNAIAPS
jgi:manganese transport protein